MSKWDRRILVQLYFFINRNWHWRKPVRSPGQRPSWPEQGATRLCNETHCISDACFAHWIHTERYQVARLMLDREHTGGKCWGTGYVPPEHWGSMAASRGQDEGTSRPLTTLCPGAPTRPPGQLHCRLLYILYSHLRVWEGECSSESTKRGF